ALREGREAEREVGAVAQAPVLLVRRRLLADVVEQLRAALRLARPEQRDAEVVANVACAGALLRQAAQRADGASVVGAQHQQLREQQAALFLELRRELALDLGERFLGFGQVAALVADL